MNFNEVANEEQVAQISLESMVGKILSESHKFQKSMFFCSWGKLCSRQNMQCTNRPCSVDQKIVLVIARGDKPGNDEKVDHTEKPNSSPDRVETSRGVTLLSVRRFSRAEHDAHVDVGGYVNRPRTCR